MKKVGIVTNYHSTGNYGALLQAYALNKAINSFPNFECKTLDLYIDNFDGSKMSRYIKKIKRGQISEFASDINKDVRKLIIRKKVVSRRTALNQFRNAIPHTETIRISDCERISEEFDILVCGSDQIWRPTFENTLVKPYWLEGFSEKIKKVSYAASMGIDSLPEKLVPEAKEYLIKFRHIAVREERAEVYLKEVTGRQDIVTVIDPVFLLTRKQWEEVEENDINMKSYILVYMIHGNDKLLKDITDFAARKKLKILSFPYMAYYYKMRDHRFGDIHDFESTPNHFLGLIKNAEYVITDSFHATAFSIIYHKKFFVSGANTKAISRIQNLLSKLRLDELLLPFDQADFDRLDENSDVDWDQVDKLIENERNYGIKYLDSSLN